MFFSNMWILAFKPIYRHATIYISVEVKYLIRDSWGEKGLTRTGKQNILLWADKAETRIGGPKREGT